MTLWQEKGQGMEGHAGQGMGTVGDGDGRSQALPGIPPVEPVLSLPSRPRVLPSSKTAEFRAGRAEGWPSPAVAAAPPCSCQQLRQQHPPSIPWPSHGTGPLPAVPPRWLMAVGVPLPFRLPHPWYQLSTRGVVAATLRGCDAPAPPWRHAGVPQWHGDSAAGPVPEQSDSPASSTTGSSRGDVWSFREER